MYRHEILLLLFVTIVMSMAGDITDGHGEGKTIGQRRSIMNMFLDKDGDEEEGRENQNDKSCSAKDKETDGIEIFAKNTNSASASPLQSTEKEPNRATSSQTIEDNKKTEHNNTRNKDGNEERFDYDEQEDLVSPDTDGQSDTRYRRIRLPPRDHMWVGKRVDVVLPGDMETEVKVLSVNPLVVEVDNFIDDEECDLLISLAKAKQPKVVTQVIQNMKVKSAKETFREWDYNEDGEYY